MSAQNAVVKKRDDSAVSKTPRAFLPIKEYSFIPVLNVVQGVPKYVVLDIFKRLIMYSICILDDNASFSRLMVLIHCLGQPRPTPPPTPLAALRPHPPSWGAVLLQPLHLIPDIQMFRADPILAGTPYLPPWLTFPSRRTELHWKISNPK